jgi:hypothetical protein
MLEQLRRESSGPYIIRTGSADEFIPIPGGGFDLGNPPSLRDSIFTVADKIETNGRNDAFHRTKERAGIPHTATPNRQWQVGDDASRAGQANYHYNSDTATHGRYYEYETQSGTKVIAEHTNDSDKPPHFHAGTHKTGNGEIRRNVDFTKERYLQVDGSHKFIY